MPTKLNSAGRQQPYDSRGRYSESERTKELKRMIEDGKKNQRIAEKEKSRIENLRNRVIKQNDPLVLDLFDKIQSSMPGTIVDANKTIYRDGKKHTELDIVTRKHIIEVKSKSAQKSEKQLLRQKEIAEKSGKIHLLYAPNISVAREREYTNKGIKIFKNTNMLIDYMRRKKHE